MAEPMSDAHLDCLAGLAELPCSCGLADCENFMSALTAVQAQELVAETRRARDELAESRASHNPLLRCTLVKAAPDRDLYIGWSNNVEAPTGIWTRAEALAYGFPRPRLDRADRNGTSSMAPGSGQWGDTGFIAEQRGWLRRDRIADYAQAYARDDMDAAWDLLEPFDDETEVRRG